jgi:hypothetical protein
MASFAVRLRASGEDDFINLIATFTPVHNPLYTMPPESGENTNINQFIFP